MKLTNEQDRALQAVSAWVRGRTKPFFYLAGAAGTGKSTLARLFAESAGNVKYAAYTGKAAQVMRAKGCDGASTLHSLIYITQRQSNAELTAAVAARAQLPDDAPEDEIKALDAKIAKLKARAKQPRFAINPDSDLKHCDLLIVDECSMVDQRMGSDLLSYGVPVLVLGDPYQLPPVGSGGYFTDRRPDFELQQVHRQARESGILALATDVRNGRKMQRSYGSDVVFADAPNEDLIRDCEQVIVGRNKTRRRYNRTIRKKIYGREHWAPMAGDRVICLRNDHDAGLLNGGIWKVVSAFSTGDTDPISLEISDGDATTVVEAFPEPFVGEDLPMWGDEEMQAFDFGYAITCHKSQGSQFGSVCVVDESYAFRSSRSRWLYTAVTRAESKLVMIG